MPDRRAHRGPHPDDARLFAPETAVRLKAAVTDLCWLLSRDYPSASSLKLVGDRYNLEQRQRTAVSRCSCSNAALARRASCQRRLNDLDGTALLIDGYNLLTTVEAGLAGGVILAARDGCFRDMASVHGTWRRVDETLPALDLIGQFLSCAGARECIWYLDRPVSNSGRLKRMLLDHSAANGWPWHVELVADPDRILAEAREPVATADSGILDLCDSWVNVAAEVIRTYVPTAWVVRIAD